MQRGKPTAAPQNPRLYLKPHDALTVQIRNASQAAPGRYRYPWFIKNLQRGDIEEAASVLKATSALPAACGRVPRPGTPMRKQMHIQ